MSVPVQSGQYPGGNGSPIYTFYAVMNRELPVLNVMDAAFGVTGNGSIDDGPALRAFFEVARTRGTGTVIWPAGRYAVSMATGLGSSHAVIAALVLPSNVTVVGGGAGSTIVQLLANQINQGYIFHNYGVAGGDSDMTIQGITVDGNAANQPGTVDAQYGMRFVRCRQVTVADCIFTNVYGTTDGSVLGPNGTPGEGFAQQFDNSTDVSVVRSLAYATSPNTSSGFASNGCTNVTRVDSVSYGWGHSMGFTDWTSTNVEHAGCHAYLNGGHGFNVELSTGVSYAGCISGGVASSAVSWPFAANQVLGNSRSGFTALSTDGVVYGGCVSANNVGDGIQISGATAGHALIQGGYLQNNGGYGVNAGSTQMHRVMVGGPIWLNGNTLGAIATGTTPAVMTVPTGVQSAPAMPASGVAISNPYPCAMLVNIIGGTVSLVALDGTTLTGITGGMIRLGATESLAITYSVAPTWQWFAAL